MAELFGVPVVECPWLPDIDQIWRTTVPTPTVMLPKFNRLGERTGFAMLVRRPLDSRWTLGMREAARDRRRRR